MPTKPTKTGAIAIDTKAARRKNMACLDRMFDTVAARVPAPVDPSARQRFHDAIHVMVQSATNRVDKSKVRAVRVLAHRCLDSNDFKHVAKFVRYVMKGKGYTKVLGVLPPVDKPRAVLAGYDLERSRLEETRLVESETKKASANSKGGMVAHL